MDIYHLESELRDLGLDFQMYVDGIVFFNISPFIVKEGTDEAKNLNPGLYLEVSAEFEEKIPYHYEFGYVEHPYQNFWINLKIVKTTSGFELIRKKKEELIEGIDESVYNWVYECVEEQLKSCKIRLLFLYPRIEAIL